MAFVGESGWLYKAEMSKILNHFFIGRILVGMVCML